MFNYLTSCLFTTAHYTMHSVLFQGKVLHTVFYEVSTRTKCSFQAAMCKLGGSIVNVDEQNSSAQKGESLGG